MTIDVTYALISILCLMVISAFLSSAETGLTSTSRSRLTELARKGMERAGLVLKLTERKERLMGALLLGKYLANISAAAVATAVLVDNIGNSGVAISAFGMTVLILVFSEILPKGYAVAYPDRVAMAVAPMMRAISAVLGPLVLAIEVFAKKILRLFGVKIDHDQDVLSAHDELRGKIDLHHREGTVIKKDRDMLGGVLDLKNLEVLDVMVHRTQMTTIDSSSPVSSVIEQVLKSGHSRLPVWRNSPENIVGILHARSLFAALQKHGGDASKINLDEIISDPWFVPDTRPLESQLAAFLRRKTHFAIVVDEYGETQGLITLEDIMEEIVGDIKDEFDNEVQGLRKNKDGSFTVDGSVPLRDVNRAMDWGLPDDEATTLAGLVIHEAKAIPDAGDMFSFHGFEFEILKKRKQQIVQIKVTPPLQNSVPDG